MPKLNYTNRKSDGPKLGAIVRKDLCKRIRSTKHQDQSPLELNLEGKALTDEGLCDTAAGLVEILTAPATSERLHVLLLAGNNLTAQSLAHLAPVIAAAASALQELDLTDNNIDISSDDARKHWEIFLHAFKKCSSIKRLSLDNNNLGSARAWESFLRIYLEHFRSNQDLWYGHALSESDLEEAMSDDEAAPVDHTSALALKVRNPLSVSRARGLPAILVFRLINTNLTDACSLFLSYVFERHHFLQNEINGCLWTPGASTANGASGILWQPNEKLGSVGLKMLKDAEAVPWHPFSAAQEDETIPSSDRHESSATSETWRASRARKGSQTSHDLQPAFRSSLHLKDSASGELESLRKKVQRGIIEDSGPHSVQLWSSALRLLTHVRQYMVSPYPLITDTLQRQAWDSPTREPAYLMPSWTRDTSPNSSLTPAASNASYNTYSSKLASETSTLSSPVSAITSVASRNTTTPKVFRLPLAQRRVSNSTSADSASASQHSPHSPSTRFGAHDSDDSPTPLPNIADLRMPSEIEMIGKLPAAALEKIFCQLADPDGILSPAQQRRVIAWARDRRTLATEQETLGKPRSVQIWRVLEGMGCITHDD